MLFGIIFHRPAAQTSAFYPQHSGCSVTALLVRSDALQAAPYAKTFRTLIRCGQTETVAKGSPYAPLWSFLPRVLRGKVQTFNRAKEVSVTVGGATPQ